VTNVAPLAPGVLKIQYVMQIGPATNVQNRWFFQFTGILDQVAASNLAGKAQSSWGTNIGPLVTQHTTLEQVIVTDLGSASGTQVVHIAGTAGTIPVTGFLPAQTCLMLTAQISRRYRGGKPRWYQSGLDQSQMQDDQNWTNTVVSNYETAFFNMNQDLAGFATNGGQVTHNINLSLVAGYSWTEYTTSSGKTNYRRDPVYRASPQEDVVISWIAAPRISNQRKRGVN
jgi:hypothetical protein